MMMLLHGASKHMILTALALVLATTLFVIPLVLRYHVYHDVSIQMTSSDWVSVGQWADPVWCSGQHMETHSESPFSAFLLPGAPSLSSETSQSSFRESFTLKSGSYKHWQFKLLEGSTLNVSACSRISTVSLTFVQGTDILQSCIRKFHEGSSEESEESPEDSETSSATNETVEFECLQGKKYPVPHSVTCTKGNQGGTPIVQDPQTFTATSSDHYYVVFSSGDHLEIIPNDVLVDFHLESVSYDVSSNLANCSNHNHCQFHFRVDQTPYVVVEMGTAALSPVESQPLTQDLLLVQCLPRKGLYFLFYLLFFVLIFVCAFQ